MEAAAARKDTEVAYAFCAAIPREFRIPQLYLHALRVCVAARDSEAADAILDLMETHGVKPDKCAFAICVLA
jgi:pentatricopeptide repeat protein